MDYKEKLEEAKRLYESANDTQKDVIAWLEKQGDKDSQVKLPTFTFDDILALQCCMETVKKVQNDKDLYEKLNDLHGRIYDAYYLEKQSEQNPYSGVSFKYNGHAWGMCARDGGVEILVDGEIKERVFLDNKPQDKYAQEATKEEKVDNQNCVKFADDVKPKIENEITIPFGAKDSELREATYYIPKGFYAEIKGDIVLIKKSKQKPEWSEEDEHRLKDTIYFLDGAKKHYASTVELDGCIDWLKSLKQRRIGG